MWNIKNLNFELQVLNNINFIKKIYNKWPLLPPISKINFDLFDIELCVKKNQQCEIYLQVKKNSICQDVMDLMDVYAVATIELI